MARKTPKSELSLIEKIIAGHPEGIGITEIEKELTGKILRPLTRRTLQRRLAKLVAEKRIRMSGESIALVYKSPSITMTTGSDRSTMPPPTVAVEQYVPVSTEGGIIRDLVRKPLLQRRPIGYQREFLDDYEPGKTFYLPKSLRAQFHEMGQTPAQSRPAGTYAREIMNRLLIDLSWASSRLEGNTYSRLDTERLIEFGQSAKGKDLQETQMILNHKAAIEMLVEEVEAVGFNSFTFLNLHALLSENLLSDDSASGRLRRRPVEISGTTFHPLALPQVLEECFHLLLQKATAIPDPFEQAFFVMVHLPYLQPFEDVNKRVSRIGANIPLFRSNLCPLSFVDIPEAAYVEGILGVYEFNQVDLLKDVFAWAYERSCQRYLAITQKMADPDPFRLQYREELVRTVQTIVQDQLTLTRESIRRVSKGMVPENDHKDFETMVMKDLERLHEGNVARYRLKLSEFQAWKTLPQK